MILRLVLLILVVFLMPWNDPAKAATDEPAPASRPSPAPVPPPFSWPVFTGAFAVLLVFAMAWMQARHRRRVEKSNRELQRSAAEARQALAALRESERKFRLLFETSSDAILLQDAETLRILDCNAAALRIRGCTCKEEILQTHPADLSPEKQPDGQNSAFKAAQIVHAAMREGSQQFEWTARRTTGECFEIEATVSPIRLDDRSLLVTVCRDITERKKSERALRESQRLLTSIADNLSEGIYRSTPDHELVFANKSFLRMFGYDSLEELRARPSEMLFASREQVDKLRYLLETQGSFVNQEVEFVRKDGSRFWGLTSSTAVLSAEKSGVSYNVGAVTDITLRKKMEADLRASEQRWRLLFEQAPISIQIFSPDGWTRQVNRAWENLFGVTQEAIAEFNILRDEQLLANGSTELIQRAFQGEVVSVPPRPFDFQANPLLPPLGVKWIGALLFPILDENGRVLEVVCIHEDFTARKQAEDAIREWNQTLEKRIAERTAELSASEARLRTLVENAPEAIVVFDGDTHKFAMVNENAVRLFGYSREELLTMGPADVSPERQPDGSLSAESARRWIAEAMEGKKPIFEWHHKNANGRTIPCEVRLVRLPGEGTNLVRGSIMDTTERRRREQIQTATYRISEAVHTATDLDSLYRQIHSIIRDLMPADNFYIALFDPATEMISFPYHVDETTSTPEPRKLTTGLTGYVLRTGKPLLVDPQLALRKRKMGDYVVLEEENPVAYLESGRPAAIWLGVPLLVEGKAIGVMAVQDYHNQNAYREEEKQILNFVAEQTALAIARKQSAESLKQRHREVTALVDSLPAYVFLKDSEGRYLLANQNFCDAICCPKEEIIGKTDYDLFPKDMAERFRADDARVVATGQTVFIGEDCMIERDREFTVETIKVPVKSEAGEVVGLIGLGFDITERKRVECELLKALAREKELGQLKSNFVSMVSHEFRTPLGIIMSSAEILEHYFEQLDAAERQEQLQSIRKNTRRMANLMEEVLVLGQVEAGKMQFSPSELDMRAFARRLIDEVQSALSPKSPIELKVAENFPQVMLADERLLNHVFSNLLTNAVKFSPEGTPVVFAIDPEKDEVVCRITDRGIGIPEQDLERLFNAFHRGRNVQQIPGTGLGLTIVRRCLELHGGNILVESKVGQGTTVTVRLPIGCPGQPSTPVAADGARPEAKPDSANVVALPDQSCLQFKQSLTDEENTRHRR